MTSKLAPAAVAATVALTLVPAPARPGGANEAPASAPADRYGTWGVDLAGMDRSVKPGDDFFRYVNGKWAATTQIPPDKTRYGAFEILRDLSEARVRAHPRPLGRRQGSEGGLRRGEGRGDLPHASSTRRRSRSSTRSPIQPRLDAIRKAKTARRRRAR